MKPLKVTLLIGLVAAGLMLGGCGSRSRTAARAICDKMVACGIPEGSDRQCILDFEDQLTYIIDVDYFVDCLDQTSCATLAADAVGAMQYCLNLDYSSFYCNGDYLEYCDQDGYCTGESCHDVCGDSGGYYDYCGYSSTYSHDVCFCSY